MRIVRIVFKSVEAYYILEYRRPAPPIVFSLSVCLAGLDVPFRTTLPRPGDPRIRYNREPGTTQP